MLILIGVYAPSNRRPISFNRALAFENGAVSNLIHYRFEELQTLNYISFKRLVLDPAITPVDNVLDRLFSPVGFDPIIQSTANNLCKRDASQSSYLLKLELLPRRQIDVGSFESGWLQS